jgi:hypothetical protein
MLGCMLHNDITGEFLALQLQLGEIRKSGKG